MELDEALAVLGLDGDVDMAQARSAYRRRVRAEHPDLSAGDAARVADLTARTASLNLAWAAVSTALEAGTLTPDASGMPSPSTSPDHGSAPTPAAADPSVDGLDGTLWLALPADEAYLALYEAGGIVGHIAYVDRHLGLLEVIVRFEGGPSCSVLITLQGRAAGTEALCTMTSIEAAEAPPIAPVLDALATALADGTLPPT